MMYIELHLKNLFVNFGISLTFQVQRIKIDDDSACSESYNGDLNPFCMENIDVSNFLNLHSLSNHEFFCLAYVFTYRLVSDCV